MFWPLYNYVIFQEKYDDAESKGEASLKAALKADDSQWQLNALVLIAQAQGLSFISPYKLQRDF